MRRILLAGLACLGLTGFAVGAHAQSDCSKTVPASAFGPDDQTGATNRITPAVTKAAAQEIQEGKVINLTNPLVNGVPLFGTRFTHTVLTAVGLAPGAAMGKNNFTFMEDTWLTQSHVGTHLDGLGHIGRGDCFYNQTAMGRYINQNNMTKLGLEHVKSFATRGVLIDLVRVFQQENKLKTNPACRKPCLDLGTVISRADIEAGLKMYNVTLREGDVVFLHTGWVDLYAQYPAQNALYNKGEPGIGIEAARYLASQKVVGVGADTAAMEVLPTEDPEIIFPVHQFFIVDNGIHIIENVKTDELAQEVQNTGRATFFLNMTVPKAVGITGNFVGIEAIR